MSASLKALLLCGLAWAACSRERTQIMIGLATDLRAKGEIDEVVFTAWRVDDQGSKIEPPVMLQSWPLTDVPAERYELPGSIGLYSPDGTEPRVFTQVEGRRNGARIVTREAIFSLVREQTLFLRLTLVSACMNSAQCTGSDVCVEGDCKPRAIDSRRLPAYAAPAAGAIDTQVTQLDCIGAIQYINTQTGQPMVASSSCPGGAFCQEGTCLKQLPEELPDLSVPGHGTLPDGFLPFDFGPPPSSNYISITGAKEIDSTITIYLGADDGSLYRWPDATSSGSGIFFETRAPSLIRHMWAASNGIVYAVGDGGVIMRRTPSGSWEQLANLGNNHLLEAIAGNTNELLIVGAVDFGALAMRSLLEPFALVGEPVPSATLAPLRGVALSPGGAGVAWAVGNNRTLLRRSNQQWTAQATPQPPVDGKLYDYFDIAGPIAKTYVAVGSEGGIGRFVEDDMGVVVGFNVETVPSLVKLNTVTAVNVTDEFIAAGEGGEIWVSQNGGAWSQLSIGTFEAWRDSVAIDGFYFAIGPGSTTLVADRVPTTTTPDMGP